MSTSLANFTPKHSQSYPVFSSPAPPPLSRTWQLIDQSMKLMRQYWTSLFFFSFLCLQLPSCPSFFLTEEGLSLTSFLSINFQGSTNLLQFPPGILLAATLQSTRRPAFWAGSSSLCETADIASFLAQSLPVKVMILQRKSKQAKVTRCLLLTWPLTFRKQEWGSKRVWLYFFWVWGVLFLSLGCVWAPIIRSGRSALRTSTLLLSVA